MTARRIVALAVLALCPLTGCRGTGGSIPAGQYSGSTQAQQSVNIVVSDKVTLDGIEMRPARNGWFVGAHDKRTKMHCRTADQSTEIVCEIDRLGRSETDELLKL